MDDILEDDCVYLEPIKKKPKTQEIVKARSAQQIKPTKPIYQPPIPIKYVRNLQAQETILQSLKITERIQPDTMQSSLKSDYTQWTHSDFVFPLQLISTEIDPDFVERLGQYFKDFNSKCKIYPYPHFVDLKPDKDHIVQTQPPNWPIVDDVTKETLPETIPLREKETGIRKAGKIQIKIEQK